jgi:hypothetical protein
MSEFPKAMNTRKAQRWIDAHNPHPKGSAAYYWHETAFWHDQTAKNLKRMYLPLGIATVALLVALAATIAEGVAR